MASHNISSFNSFFFCPDWPLVLYLFLYLFCGQSWTKKLKNFGTYARYARCSRTHSNECCAYSFEVIGNERQLAHWPGQSTDAVASTSPASVALELTKGRSWTLLWNPSSREENLKIKEKKIKEQDIRKRKKGTKGLRNRTKELRN